MRVVHRGALAALVLALVAWASHAVWTAEPHHEPDGPDVAGQATGASGLAEVLPLAQPQAAGHEPGPAAPPQALPAGLAGTQVPDGLSVDVAGHLVRGRGVRDVFDYFLATANERTPAQIDALVREHLASRLQAPARQEAIELWQHYRAYLDAAQQQLESMAVSDPAPMRPLLERRAALRRQYLGEQAGGWAGLWFDDEEAQDRDQLERFQIAADSALTPQQRDERLRAVDSRDPRTRQAMAAGAKVAALGQVVGSLQEQGGTPESIAAAVAQRSDAATGERIKVMLREDAAWEQRYAS